MHFYHYKIKQSSSINHAVTGNFSGYEKPEIIISRGRTLEIFTVNLSSGHICLLLSIDFNSRIRSLGLVPNVKKDYVAVGSDSGKIVILEFKLKERCFEPVLEHRFEHKFKVSDRFTPGEYLAVDPKSQALMIGAIEETLMFYIICKGSDEFSVPVTIQKPMCIFFDLVQLHTDSGKPLFASLEAEYEEIKYKGSSTEEFNKPGSSSQSNKPTRSSEKSKRSSRTKIPDSILKEFKKLQLSATVARGSERSKSRETKEADEFTLPPMVLRVYEWDLQSRSKTLYVSGTERHANKLVSVPPGGCHKGGVIVCFCNELDFLEIETQEQARCFIPQRRNYAFNNNKGLLISGSATYKKDDKLLILLQSEEGDLYSTEIVRVDERLKIKMTYVDTIPTASAMCIIEGEFLFLGADYGDHYLYKIKSLGSEDEFKKTIKGGMLQLFAARKVENLDILSRLEGLAPVIKCIASEHACNGLLQFYFACGRETSSTLRTLRHGVEVAELFVHNFPQNSFPSSMWTFKEQSDAGFITYIVVSFAEDTMVLSLNKEIKIDYDSGFRHKIPTLNCVQVGADSSVQVYPSGFRYICQRKGTDWKVKCCCKKKKKGIKPEILQSAIHNNQIALTLVCKEVVYIEIIKSADGSLDFMEKRGNFKWGANCMEFVPCMPKAELLVVCFRNSMHIYSVGLQEITEQDLPSTPSSLVVCNAVNENHSITYLNIGFEDGSIQRSILNEKKEIENAFSLKLDSKRVKLIKLQIDKEDAILALSSIAWISFNCKSQFNLVPLLYEKLDCAAGFSTTFCPQANLIAVSNEQLVFLWTKNFASLFTESRQQLELAPRQSLVNSKHKLLIMSLNDYRPPYFKDGDVTPQMALDLTLGVSKHKASDPNAKYLCDIVTNRPAARYDCELHIFDPINKEFVFKLVLPLNHTTGRMCLVELDSKPNEQYLLSAVKYCTLMFPEEEWIGYVCTYKVSDNGKSLSQVDKTEMSDVPGAICSYQGHVLIGVEKILWMCDLQEKLVMSACLEMPCTISNIFARGILFVVICKYYNVIYGYWNKEHNLLVKLHEDRYLHKVATLCFWDDDIIVAADLDGYLKVILLPAIPLPSVVKGKVGRLSMEFDSLMEVDEEREPNIDRFRFMPKSYLIVKHYLGEIVTSLQRTSFLKGGRDVILYTTLSGTVGVLVPFLNETADIIFKPIQYLLKGKSPFHNKDSTEWPKEGENVYKLFEKEKAVHVIDGNLCDLFNTLSKEDQQEVANYLEEEPYAISEKLAELKAKIYFKDCHS